MIDFEEIEQYASGEMDPDAVKRFEERMLSDTELAIEVELYLSLQREGQIIESQSAEKARLKATLQQLNQQHFSQQPSSSAIPIASAPEPGIEAAKIFPIRKLFAWAISTAAVLAVLLLIRNLSAGKPNNQQLYAQYAVREELIHERGADNNPLRRQADSLYNAENYAAATPLLELILAGKDSADTDYKMALGFSYMENNNYGNAAKIFDEIAAGSSSSANRARLYKALLLLKQDKKDACIKQLQFIPSTSSEYKNAQALLDQLQ